MQSTWIVVADSSRARIFERHDPDRHLEEVEDFINEAGRMNSGELRTDERGRFFGKGERQMGHTADPSMMPYEHENEIFSRQLGDYLERAHNDHRYEQLCLVAAPKFLGLLRDNLNKEVKKTVKEELPNDISKFSIQKIEEFVSAKLNGKAQG